MSRIAPPSGEPVDPIKRNRLTPKQRAQIHHDNDGLCHLCGEPVSLEEMEDEHVNSLQAGGSNDLRNRKPAHPACHKLKSAAERWVGAKINRIRKKQAGDTKPSRLQSRGFSQTLRKRMDGSVQRKEQR